MERGQPGFENPREQITKRDKAKPKPKPNKFEDNKREAEAKRGHMDGTQTHGILLNQILAYEFGNFSGREGNPRSSELPLRAPKLRCLTFLNSPISSPQITSTVIRPCPLSPSRSCSRPFQNRNFTHVGGVRRRKRRRCDQVPLKHIEHASLSQMNSQRLNSMPRKIAP